MHLKIKPDNQRQLSEWMSKKADLGHTLLSILGPPPPGATYSDGELIKKPVNVAWKDCETGEVFHIEYQSTKP